MAHGTIKIDTVKSSTAGLAPVFVDSADREIIQGCTAWVNLDGSGTPSATDSFNVSSITDGGSGNYDVNFATAMTNANYAALMTAEYGAPNTKISAWLPTTAKVGILVGVDTGAGYTWSDMTVNVVILGGL